MILTLTRYLGNKKTVLLPGTSHATGHEVAQRWRQRWRPLLADNQENRIEMTNGRAKCLSLWISSVLRAKQGTHSRHLTERVH